MTTSNADTAPEQLSSTAVGAGVFFQTTDSDVSFQKQHQQSEDCRLPLQLRKQRRGSGASHQ